MSAESNISRPLHVESGVLDVFSGFGISTSYRLKFFFPLSFAETLQKKKIKEE